MKLKVPHGGFLAGLTLWSPKRQEGATKIVGPAYTVKYVRKSYENGSKVTGHYVRQSSDICGKTCLPHMEEERRDGDSF